MEELKPIERVVLGEIEGKNAAIHAYDKITWTARSGFLSLLFGGWGLLVGLAKENVAFGELAPAAVVLLFVSAGLAVGGFVVDYNYVRRKFKVIFDLNALMEYVIDHPSVLVDDGSVAESGRLRAVMRVSGDTDGGRPASGFRHAVMAGVAVYVTPTIMLTAGVAVGTLLF